jgi:S-adenosylmethionine:tRNA ribosyltransferase-isomerase
MGSTGSYNETWNEFLQYRFEETVLRVADFDYALPSDRIAQHPSAKRDASRLLTLDRASGSIGHLTFRDLPPLLHEGDLLLVNDTRVIPARLYGRLRRADPGPLSLGLPPAGTAAAPDRDVEIFLLREEPSVPPERIWTTLARPARALQPGATVHFTDPSYSAHVIGAGERGVRHVAFRPATPSSQPAPGRADSRFSQLAAQQVESKKDDTLGESAQASSPETGSQLAPGQVVPFETWLSRVGHIPLPPYIDRADEPEDRERYQTIFAHDSGSVAAPTAGLHFTEDTIAAIRARGASLERVTLHVGPGTFRPVATEDPSQHVLDPEPYRVPPGTVAAIHAARERRRAGGSGRIIAVGTTAVRTLESWALTGEPDDGAWRETGLFILPPFEFRVIDGMITNFHLPRSSLLMLVSALAGRERVLHAYREAVVQGYRFYSYGDAMLIL